MIQKFNFKENSTLCDVIAETQNTIDNVKQEREFLARKLIEHEPSAVELVQPYEPRPYKKRKNSSSDTSSINKPLKKKEKVQQSLLKKQTMVGQSPIPKLPVVIDGITVLSLGRIILDRPAFYNDSCIYPSSYKITRLFMNKIFSCRIVDNGEQSPIFQISLVSDPTNFSFSGQTTDDVHAELLQAFDTTIPFVLDGDSFFGLKNKRIREFINMLPNAKRLIKIKEEKQDDLIFE